MHLPVFLFRPFAGISVCASLAVFGFQPAGAQSANATAAVHRAVGAPVQHVLSLEPLTDQEVAAQSLSSDAKTLANAPASFRQFGSLQAGQVVAPKAITLRFAEAAKLNRIESTPDFVVEQGGSCLEGNSYAANATCTLMVRFTPKGPGRRMGKLSVTSSASVTPLFVGLGGFGSAPAISFTPSVISTVAGTYVSGAGLFSGASNLTTDGGDTLYIPDTGHQALYELNSSGVIMSNPNVEGSFVSVAADATGTLYLAQNASNFLDIYSFGDTAFFYTGSAGCAIGSTCPLQGANIYTAAIGGFAVDPDGTIFLNLLESAAKMSDGNYVLLDTPGNFDYDHEFGPEPLAVDASDNLYTYYETYQGEVGCRITAEPYYDATTGTSDPVLIAGGGTCGFSGDGGQARGAEIGRQVGQMTFDIAGNLYFSDMLNQRVRRIDGLTGIITTIAGNGSAGYSGDYGPATSATLNNPTGVAVDSQGQVYILSSSATTGTAQVVRKVGTVGALNLGSAAVGSSTVAQTVTVANTGNSNLDFTHVGFSGGNTSDFTMDVNTTSCNFTVPLASGRSCKIGFIFKPTATGTRSAVLSITDDTVTGINTVQVSGTGTTTATLSPASLSFASTTVGSTSASQKVTLVNTGSAGLTISSIAFSGAAAYTDTTTCGTTVAVGSSCTIAISFKPAAAGTQTATLTVSDNAVGSRQTVALTGTGVAAAAKASISPSSLTFASTTVGSSSAAQTITLSNTGTAALGVTSIKSAGTNAADYILSQSCGTSVAAGGSCKITVTFKPAAAGTRTGSVSIVVSTGTLTASLTGTAVAAAIKKAVLSPASTSFGSQAVSVPSAARTMTLTNSSGAAVTISSWSWSGSAASDFTQNHTCGTAMAAGASCSIAVVFRPTATGARAASLTVKTSTGAMTASMTGVGVGEEGQPHQSPVSVPFVPRSGPEPK